MSNLVKRAVVVVHGAWASPELYTAFNERLSARGWDVHCPLLPTCNNARPPTATRDDDVNTIRQLVRRLVEDGYPVFVLMHSYGGIVGSEAVPEELSVLQRSKSGLSGGIARLIFMSAFILLPGQNVVEGQGYGQTGGTDAREANSQEMDAEYYEDGTCKLLSSAKTSFTLLPPEEAEYWATKLPVFPFAAGMAPATRAPWKDLPTTYAYGKKDNSILLSIQEGMVRRAKEKIGIHDLVEEYLDTDHSPQLSAPDEIIAVLERAWTGYMNAVEQIN